MFYRRAGIRHTRYEDERQLFPLTFDRVLIIAILVLLLSAPFWVERLYLVGYMVPRLRPSAAPDQINQGTM